MRNLNIDMLYVKDYVFIKVDDTDGCETTMVEFNNPQIGEDFLMLCVRKDDEASY